MSQSQLHHNFTLSVSTEVFESRTLSSIYNLLTLDYIKVIMMSGRTFSQDDMKMSDCYNLLYAVISTVATLTTLKDG